MARLTENDGWEWRCVAVCNTTVSGWAGNGGWWWWWWWWWWKERGGITFLRFPLLLTSLNIIFPIIYWLEISPERSAQIPNFIQTDWVLCHNDFSLSPNTKERKLKYTPLSDRNSTAASPSPLSLEFWQVFFSGNKQTNSPSPIN